MKSWNEVSRLFKINKEDLCSLLTSLPERPFWLDSSTSLSLSSSESELDLLMDLMVEALSVRPLPRRENRYGSSLTSCIWTVTSLVFWRMASPVFCTLALLVYCTVTSLEFCIVMSSVFLKEDNLWASTLQVTSSPEVVEVVEEVLEVEGDVLSSEDDVEFFWNNQSKKKGFILSKHFLQRQKSSQRWKTNI